MRDFGSLIIEVIALQSPRGRLIFFALVSMFVIVMPYDILGQLSLWQRIGVDAPSIGLTRAYRHLLNAEISAAWDRNPLIFLVIAVGLPILIRDAYLLYRQQAKL